MKIKQFPFDHETLGTIFGYLLYSNNEGILIDPNSHREVDEFCKENNITIRVVTNTHDHADHTMGNNYFVNVAGIPYLSVSEALREETIDIGVDTVRVMKVPGHTADSIAFYSDSILVSGDTLFNGTVGNCYTGNYEEYFESLSSLLSLPGNTKVYAGHDLVDYATGVAREIDPENNFIEEYISLVKGDDIHSTIEMELKVNPFVRWNDQTLDRYRATLKMPVSTPYERFMAMMSVH